MIIYYQGNLPQSTISFRYKILINIFSWLKIDICLDKQKCDYVVFIEENTNVTYIFCSCIHCQRLVRGLGIYAPNHHHFSNLHSRLPFLVLLTATTKHSFFKIIVYYSLNNTFVILTKCKLMHKGNLLNSSVKIKNSGKQIALTG